MRDATDVATLRLPASELRRRVRPALRSAGVHRAVAFGSWARGEADGFSDLDLAVVMETRLARLERAATLAAEQAAEKAVKAVHLAAAEEHMRARHADRDDPAREDSK